MPATLSLFAAALPILLASLPSPDPFLPQEPSVRHRVVLSGQVNLGGANAWRLFSDGIFQDGGTGEGFKVPYGETLTLHGLSGTLDASDRRNLIQLEIRLTPAVAGDFPLARMSWRHQPGNPFTHTHVFRPPLVIPGGSTLVISDRSARPARFEVLLQGYLTR